MSPTLKAQYQAYNAAAQTVGKTRQIVMLYDGAIRYMRQAGEAIKENRIEDRYNLLVKASEVILGLQGCLDFENGGQVAVILHDYYSSIDARIISIHRSNNADMCEQIVSELKDMRDAWELIDREGVNHAAQADNTAATSSDQTSATVAATPQPEQAEPSSVYFSA